MISPESSELHSDAARALWTEVRDRAALLGAFNPVDLVGDLDDNFKIEALGALSHECSEIVDATSTRWQLKPDTRRRILQTLDLEGRLASVIANVQPVDVFGQALAGALKGSFSIPHDATLGVLGAINSALQFAAPHVAVDAQQGELERVVATREREAAIQSLTPVGLIGREGLLDRLDGFANGKGPGRLVVSGAGGSGKSALLAAFLQRNQQQAEPRPIIWLDFDRAALAEVEATDLMIELSRQLGLALPKHRAALQAFRATVEQRRANAREKSEQAYSGAAVERTVLWELWKQHGLAKALRKARPILVLDTIEEILVQDDGRDELLYEWLDMLQTSAIESARVILSGRAGTAIEQITERLNAETILVDDLDDLAAAELLHTLLGDQADRVGNGIIVSLVMRYGGNPLTLTIMARYLKAADVDAPHELLSDSGSAGFDQDYAQNALYRRIVQRIRSKDRDLMKLAYPGLVLRRVTPGLIREVLAEPCGIGAISVERSETLFEKLRSQIWLVERGESDASLIHRRDVRRSMVQAMRATPSQAIQDIHRAAVLYHQQAADEALGATSQAIEALYHRAFCGSELVLEDHELVMLASRIGADVADLPADEQRRVRQLQQGVWSSDPSGSTSPHQLRQAQSLIHRRSRRLSPFRGSFSRSPGADVNEAFVWGDLESVASRGGDVVDEFVDDLRRYQRRDTTSFIQWPIWRLAIVTTGTPMGQTYGRYLADRIASRSLIVDWVAPLWGTKSNRMRVADAVTAVLRLLGTPIPPQLRYTDDHYRRSDRIERLDELRVYWLNAAHEDHIRPARVAVGLLPFLSSACERLQTLPYGVRPDINFPREGQNWLDRLYGAAQARRPSIADIEPWSAAEAFFEIRPGQRRDALIDELLRGMLVDIHAPVQSVVEQMSHDAILECARELERSHHLWPRELTAVELRKTLPQDDARWIGTMIETADRCGMLNRLVAMTMRYAPGEHSQAIDDMLFRFTKSLTR